MVEAHHVARGGDGHDVCTLDTCRQCRFTSNLLSHPTPTVLPTSSLLGLEHSSASQLPFFSGCILKVLEYIGRLTSHSIPVNEIRSQFHIILSQETQLDRRDAFLLQIGCLTIDLTFLTTSLYLTISRSSSPRACRHPVSLLALVPGSVHP